MDIRYIFRENFAIYVPCEHSLDCNKTLFSLLFVVISTPLKLRYYLNEKSWNLLFSLSLKMVALIRYNKFLNSANAFMVLLFCGGNVETWLGLMHVNTEGGSLGLGNL